MLFRSRPALLYAGLFTACLGALAACSGGSSVTPAPAVIEPTPPATVPTLAPAVASSTMPLPAGTPAAVSVAIPAAAGISGAIALPAASIPPNESLSVTTSTTAITGVPALDARRHAMDRSANSVVLYFQGVMFSQAVTFPSYPALTLALPTQYNASAGSYRLAFYNGSTWTAPFGSAGTPLSSSQLQFTAVSGPVTFAANTLYVFALYYEPTPATPAPNPTATATPTPSPSPSPTASPTPSPSPAATATPTSSPTAMPTATPTPSPTPTPAPAAVDHSSLTFNGTGSSLSQTVTITAGTAPFTVDASACNGSTPVASASTVTNNQFTVTPQNAGTCSITVTDARSTTASVAVTVTTSSLSVSNKGKK